jgi:hypothetical protein
MSGNNIIGSPTFINGYSLSIISQTNCVVSISGLVITVTSLNANNAEAEIRVSKVGYQALQVSLKMMKIYQGPIGITGAQGIQGIRGAQGVSGPAGQDGGSYITIHKLIEVNTPREVESTEVSDNGSGKVRITTTAPDFHGYEVGEYIQIYTDEYDGIDLAYNDVVPVLAIIDNTHVDLDIDFTIAAKVILRRASHEFGRADSLNYFNTLNYQLLYFPNILPVGAKIDQIAIYKKSGSDGYLTWYAGTEPYPSTNFNTYMNGIAYGLPAFGDEPRQVDLHDITRVGYKEYFIYDAASIDRNVYFYVGKYNLTDSWQATFYDNIFDIYISYKLFTPASLIPDSGSFIVDNSEGGTETGIVLIGTTSDRNIKVDLVVMRDGRGYSQQIDFLYDGTNLFVSPGVINPYISDDPILSITFDGEINGTNIRLTYSSLDIGSDVNVTWKKTKIL